MYGLIGGLVSLTMLYLKKSSARKVKVVKEGMYVLRLHLLYQLIGILSVVVGFVLLLLPLLQAGLEALPIALSMFGMFGVLGLVCILWYNNHFLRFNNGKIEARSWLGKTTVVQWDNIRTISFNSLSGLLTITDTAGVQVKAHMHLVGLNTFVKQIEEKTSWTAKGLKLPLA